MNCDKCKKEILKVNSITDFPEDFNVKCHYCGAEMEFDFDYNNEGYYWWLTLKT